jgi:peroxiredoxin
LGASFDTVEEQKVFADSESFPYRLLADPAREAGAAYEVARPADHKAAGWPRRASYLIGPDGLIAKSYDFRDSPDLSEHAQEVLNDINSFS